MYSFANCVCVEKWGPVAPFALRLVAGLVFLLHGWQKFAGGVDGFGSMLANLSVPAPEFMAWIVVLVEIVGGAFLILGLLTHWSAKLLAIDMLVAVLLVHASNGFFVAGGGAEFALLLLAATLSLMVTGAGPWSLDAMMKKK